MEMEVEAPFVDGDSLCWHFGSTFHTVTYRLRYVLKTVCFNGKTSIFVRISKSWRSTLWAGHAWRGVLPGERVPSRIWVWSFPSHTSQPGTPPGPWGHTRVGWAPESSGNTRHPLERNRVKQNTQAFVMYLFQEKYCKMDRKSYNTRLYNIRRTPQKWPFKQKPIWSNLVWGKSLALTTLSEIKQKIPNGKGLRIMILQMGVGFNSLF